jgi:predicted dehydrogenase
MKIYRVGIVGYGVAGKRHFQALRSIPGFEVAGILETDRDVTLPAERAANLDSLMSNTDIVAVCAPTGLHLELAESVLKAERHLFLEKPICLNLQQADRLIELSQKLQASIQVGYNLRHHRLVRRGLKEVANGAIGEIRALNTVIGSGLGYRIGPEHWKTERARGGGVLMEIGTHHFDLWRAFTGQEVESVNAQSFSTGHLEDATAVVQAKLTGGVLASTTICQTTSPVNQLDIYGTEGRLQISIYSFDGLKITLGEVTDGAIKLRAQRFLSTLKELPEWYRNRAFGGDYVASYRNEWLQYYRCLEEGREPEANLKDGREALRISLEAAIASATRPSTLLSEI